MLRGCCCPAGRCRPNGDGYGAVRAVQRAQIRHRLQRFTDAQRRARQPVRDVSLNGEHVKVVGCDVWKDAILWSEVEVERFGLKFTGWVSAAFLVTYVGYDEPRDSFTEAGARSPAAANLRAAPGLTGSILRTVPYGTMLNYDHPDVIVDDILWQS